MLRYSLLAGFLLLGAGSAFSQVLFHEDFQEPQIHRYRELNKFPQWARSFADSTLEKVGIKPAFDLRQPVYTQDQRNLPVGTRPMDYIGRDGLPGDPLPAIHYPQLQSIYTWEDSRKEVPVPTPRKKLLDELK